MATISTPIHSGFTIINGSISGSTSSKIGTWMEYKVVSQSIENNTSKIRFYVMLATLSGSYNVYANNHSGTNRGAMSVTANGSTIYTREKNGFATGTVPSAGNYVTQYDQGYNSAAGVPFLTILTDNASSESAAYGEYTVTHNADGTGSVTLAWSGDCSFSSSIGLITGSATISLPTIPRATTPSVGTLTMGSASTITLNPASSSFTHTLRYTVGSATGTIVTKTSNTSISWTPALTLANQSPNATTAVGTLYCDTYSGTTLVGTKSVSISLNIPSSVVPSATYTLTDSNSAIATKFGAFIQSKSKVVVAITATGAYGSTISSVTTTINGTTYTGTSFTTEELTGSGSQSISITVKDSRARTKTVTGTFTVLAYKPPQITELTAFRCNSSGVASHTGTYVSIRVAVTITSLNSKNDSTIKAQQKRKTATSYSNMKTWTGSYTLSGSYVTGGSLSNQYAYDIRLAATDYFETVYAYADLATADTILSIRNNGLGLAIGKISEQNMFEVGWPSEFHEPVTFNESVSFSDLGWLLDLIYPVGSIRMTTSTTGATTFLGGTWELWGAGKVPVGVDTSDNDFKTVEKTGGAKTVALAAANLPSHSHTLASGTVTVAQAAAHTHQAASGTYKVGSGSGSTYKYFTNGGSTGPADTLEGGAHSHTATLSGSTGTIGSGTAHSNVQPYITCYFYKRTA